MITDGFANADSLANLPGSVVVATFTGAGLTINASVQECRGRAEVGDHGWYHVGIDFVDAETGKVLDSIPVSEGADGTHGHFSHDAAVAKAKDRVTEWKNVYKDAIANLSADKVTHDKWVDTILTMKADRMYMEFLEELVSNSMLGAGNNDDFLPGLLGLSDDEDTEEVDILGDFDPFAAGPTDEGLTDDR